MCELPVMRTLPELAKEIREKDPNTQLKLSTLRKLTKSGVIPCVYVGRTALVNVSEMQKHLNESSKRAKPVAGIRRVGE